MRDAIKCRLAARPCRARGVVHVLRILRDELELAMGLTGCRTLSEASRNLLLPDAG